MTIKTNALQYDKVEKLSRKQQNDKDELMTRL